MGLTSAQREVYGATPFDVYRFTSNFRVWKITNHLLGPGESFCHNMYYNVNKKLNLALVQNLTNSGSATANTGAVKGLTQYCFVVMQPYPAHETSVKTNISVPLAALDLITYQKFTSYQIHDANKAITQQNAYNTVFATAAQQEMEDLDVVANVAT